MRLTVFSDYTLRVLIYLGARPDGLATIADIAQAYAISRNHLMKVVHYLGTQGYIETLRGKGGGLRLKRTAERISVGEVLRATEADTPLVECFERKRSECRIQSCCVLSGLLAEAREAFFSTLDSSTLADLLRPQRQLAAILLVKRPGSRGAGAR